MDTTPREVRRTSLVMRVTFIVTCLPVVLGGVQLYILTENTAKYFAWTIAVPVSAAVLGTFYFTAAPLLLMGVAQRSWAGIRALLAGSFVAVTLLLIMTLTRLDEFHLQSDDPSSAVIAAVVWLVVYFAVPVAFAFAYWVQRRMPGTDPPPARPLRASLRAYFAAVAIVLFATGVALYLVPVTMADVWPWPLAELASMAIGSWYIGLGVMMGLATLVDNDLDRFFVPAAGFAILGAWHLSAIARYPGDVDFGNVLAWVDLLLFGSILVVGIYAASLSRRGRSSDVAASRAEATIATRP